MSGNGHALVIEGDSVYYTTAGAIVSSWDGGAPTGATALEALETPRFTISERLRPIEGDLEVSALDFVVHATGGDHITALWTRDEENNRATYLVASITSSATTLNVASSSAVGALPRVVWVAGEAMLATAAPTSTTLTVTRGYLGTQARAIESDAAQGIQPEVTVYPATMVGRRVRFYKVVSGVASLRWVGYVRGGPTLSDNGVSYAVSCVSAWDQEKANSLALQQSAATLTGYDARAIRGAVVISDGTIILGPAWTANAHPIYGTLSDALTAFARALGDDATAKGASDVIASARSTARGTFNVSLQYGTLARGEGFITVAGQQTNARVFENSGTVLYEWDLDIADDGALVLPGFGVPGQSDRATVIAPQYGLRSTDWVTVAGSTGDTTITPVLRGNLSDDLAIELDATTQTTPGVVTGDADFATLATTSAGQTTFRAIASLAPRDLSMRAGAGALPGGNLSAITTALPLYHTAIVRSSHWLDAMRSVLEDDTFATSGSDSRNWTWSRYPVTRRLTGSALGAVEFRLSGGRTVGDFAVENAMLRGACVSVFDGLLTVVAVREPNAAASPVTTLTEGDLIRETRTQWTADSEGVVTEVRIASPVRDLAVRDSVAVSRYGTQRAITVTTDGVRGDARAASDPVGWALHVANGLLARWRKPVSLYSLTVAASSFEPLVRLGDVIAFASYNAPNGNGGRGFTSRRAVVIGRHENLESNELTLDVLALPTARGFAPACRVASISGATLTVATGYAGDAGDYAGSGLVGYEHTANDGGVSRFANGDKVRLVRRDAATSTLEDYTVASVDAVAKTITLTASVAAVPTNWGAIVSGGGIVDVVFQSYSASQASQRVFAAVADEGTREITSSVAAQKWAP